MEYDAFRLLPGMDLRQALQTWAERGGIEAAVLLSGVGSLTHYAIRMANQPAAARGSGYFEITSLAGTISRYGLHLHLTIADENGQCLGGHLMEGCRIYTTAEIVAGILPGLRFSREMDHATGFKELVVHKN